MPTAALRLRSRAARCLLTLSVACSFWMRSVCEHSSSLDTYTDGRARPSIHQHTAIANAVHDLQEHEYTSERSSAAPIAALAAAAARLRLRRR